MRSHPEMGFGQISETVLSHVPREIILHHHEKRNGKGYPHGLDEKSLLPEVQIATLADIFDALTSSRTYQTARTKFEALDFIKSKLLKEEICPEAFKALVMCLAPKAV
jgi:HD-GYP domain-containing protein (c-di-GMP phosphodiesterase class II)